MNKLSSGSPANLRSAHGEYADGFEPVVETFARHLDEGTEIGGSLCIYHRGEKVVDIWGGLADIETKRPWEEDTRIVVFSVTKGIAAMALQFLADRGLLDWDAPVATYWPEFGQAGKEDMTVSTMVGHRGGLAFLDTPVSIQDCITPSDRVREAMESQRPAWIPEQNQGYHALTWGLYARELFERIADEQLNDFLRRELLDPLDSDVWIGAPAELDSKLATLYPARKRERVPNMLLKGVLKPESTEGRVFRGFLKPDSLLRKAFLNPKADPSEYNKSPIVHSTLAWGAGSGSARGIARAYLPFANGGEHDGTRYLKSETLEPLYERQGWSNQDLILNKPVGWSNGFLKEELSVFGQDTESFGHAGMGGALGWCNPVKQLAFGYAQNKMDWRIRSPRAVALTHAMYRCEPVMES